MQIMSKDYVFDFHAKIMDELSKLDYRQKHIHTATKKEGPVSNSKIRLIQKTVVLTTPDRVTRYLSLEPIT